MEVIEAARAAPDPARPPAPGGRPVMLVVGCVVFLLALAAAYRPMADEPGSVALAVVPWVVGAAMLVALGPWFGTRLRWLATSVALVGWLVLVADDPRWSVFAFVAYALCFQAPSAQPLAGLILGGLLTLGWTVAWLLADPGWIAAVPVAVFVGSAALAAVMTRERQLVEAQADLIERLRAMQAELAASERTRGVLEERARMAGEIHDTLAQGFTSIVLLSRSARRGVADGDELAEIEAEAQANLDAARRLVESSGPIELSSVSLPAAIERAMDAALGDRTTSSFAVVGEARPLPGETEVLLLRAAQEAVANVVAHAGADHVEAVLTYGRDTVDLVVRDDGSGFADGEVADRGRLTGGQGLRTLAGRAASLGGRLDVTGDPGRGTVLRLTVPDGAR